MRAGWNHGNLGQTFGFELALNGRGCSGVQQEALALQETQNSVCCLVGCIFVHTMARVCQHNKLELSCGAVEAVTHSGCCVDQPVGKQSA